MSYDKKYIQDGDFVDDYLNDREDEIECAFKSFIDSGSNANGSWVKFPDGTMICFADISLDRSSSKLNQRQIFYMPQRFVSPPVVGISHKSGTYGRYMRSSACVLLINRSRVGVFDYRNN